MRLLLSIPLILLCTFLNAQVKVTGKMLHFTTQKELKVSQVNVINMDTDERYSLVSSNGKYKVKLENSGRYKVEYTKEGFYNKFLMIDTRGIPSGKSMSLYVDMDMVEVLPKLDGGVFSEAMGIATYQADIRQMGWNLDYSKKRFEEVNAAFEALSNINEPKIEDTEHQEDEPYIPSLKSPFQITYKFRSLINPEATNPSLEKVNFKKTLLSGMILADLALHADDEGTDKRIGMLRSFETMEEGIFSTKDFQIRLANAAGKQDSIDAVMADLYFTYQDETMTSHKNEALLETGSFLEILYQVLRAYPSKANMDLNNFLGTASTYLETLISYQSDDVSDAELSFNSDIKEIMTTLEAIEYKPGGEMIQSDMLQTPHYFDITPEILQTLIKSVTQIRANLL